MNSVCACVRVCAVRDTVQCQGGLWLDGCQSCCRPDEKKTTHGAAPRFERAVMSLPLPQIIVGWR